MLCSKCGTENSNGSAFCKECGASIKVTSNTENPPHTVNSKKLLSKTQKMGIGIAAVIIIGGGLVYGLNHKTTSSDSGSSTSSSSSSDLSDNSASPNTSNTGWVTIGSQTWAKTNLNVGTMITGTTQQTGNSVIEKYCYNDLESNCTTYGGLYQWGEAMQFATIQGSQGICPDGSHIPSDSEWATLTTYLGSATAATQLMLGGTSGLNIPLAGYSSPSGSFFDLSSHANLWSSSESSTSAWGRTLYSDITTLGRNRDGKGFGLSVRCIKN